MCQYFFSTWLILEYGFETVALVFLGYFVFFIWKFVANELNPKLKEIEKIHNFLESQPETGKVLSLATLYKLAKGLNDNEPLSDLQVGAITVSYTHLTLPTNREV